MAERALHVLVVDDTVVYRRVLQKVVAEIPGAEVVGIAANGRIALDKLTQLDVDVVLLDVEMPEMGGLEALREIRQRWPRIGVVLLSGADRHAADITMKALELGALDFVAKADTGDVQRNQRQLVGQLTAIMRAFEVARSLGRTERVSLRGRASISPGAVGRDRVTRSQGIDGGVKSEINVEGRKTTATGTEQRSTRGADGKTRESPGAGGLVACAIPKTIFPIDVLLIGSSTGGPQALAKVIPALPSDLGIPVLVVQHMPPVFTASLAESLNRASKIRVVEASDNQLIVANTVFIAPGGRHMVVKGELGSGEKRIVLNDEPPVNSVRPAVDVLFMSAAQLYGGNTLSVILTGMGEDGREGVRVLRTFGGQTLTQDAASCVVYGMPRAVEQARLSDESVPLDDLAIRIALLVRKLNVSRAPPIRGATL
jgi:two-component system chemotaxis response regulator CheB